MTDKRDRRNNGRGGQIPQAAGMLFFLLVSLAFVVVHVRAFSPNPVRQQPPLPDPGDRASLSAAMSTNAVTARFSALADFGSRAPGQPGLKAAQDAIENAFKELGLEIYRQDVDFPYPLLRDGSGWISNETFRRRG